LRALAILPFVVSPILVAFGLLLLYPSWTASAPLLVAAYALLAYPFVATSLAAGLDGMPAHYLAAACTLGASPWRAFWRITWPLLQPALRRGMAFAAATAVGEFAVTLFLSRPEWATLTTLIYERLGRPGAANRDAALVLACLLMAGWVSEFHPATLWAGLPRIGEYFSRIAPSLEWGKLFAGTDTEGSLAFWMYRLDDWGLLLFETAQMAALATLMGAAAGLLLAFPAARNLGLPGWMSEVARRPG
jgi:ABC-type Fe3+ transport system permease subunit